jgi:hypothetical protein
MIPRWAAINWAATRASKLSSNTHAKKDPQKGDFCLADISDDLLIPFRVVWKIDYQLSFSAFHGSVEVCPSNSETRATGKSLPRGSMLVGAHRTAS